MSGNNDRNPESENQLHVTWAGSFGRAVAGYLSLLEEDAIIAASSQTTLPDNCARARSSAEAVAAWQPMPLLCDSLAALSWRLGLPFIPLVVDCGAMRLGPVLLPGRSGCWDCWKKRCQQHAPGPRETQAMLQFYGENSQAGPKGFLQPFAMLGADQIRRALHLCSNDPEQIAGYVWQFDLFSRKVNTGRLMGVDGCPACGLGRSIERRSYMEVREELAGLWEGLDCAQ